MLIAEVGSLRARVADLERQLAASKALADERELGRSPAREAGMTDRCPNCDLPVATQAECDGSQTGSGAGKCWRLWHGDLCVNDPVDWRERALRATNVDALVRVIDSALRICHRNQWHGAATVQRKIAEAIRAHVLGEEFDS